MLKIYYKFSFFKEKGAMLREKLQCTQLTNINIRYNKSFSSKGLISNFIVLDIPDFSDPGYINFDVETKLKSLCILLFITAILIPIIYLLLYILISIYNWDLTRKIFGNSELDFDNRHFDQFLE